MKPEELRKIRERASEGSSLGRGATRMEIRVDMGTSGIAAGSRTVLQAFRDAVAERKLTDVSVMQTGERGWASCEPVAEIREVGKPPVFYSCLTAEKVKRIVAEHIMDGRPIEDYRINPAG